MVQFHKAVLGPGESMDQEFWDQMSPRWTIKSPIFVKKHMPHKCDTWMSLKAL